MSAATWRYGLGSQAHELREDLAPKAQRLQCLSQRQRFLPVSPVDRHSGATPAEVGFSLGFSFRRLQLSAIIHRSPYICPVSPNGAVLQSCHRMSPAGTLHPPCQVPVFLGSVVCTRVVVGAEHSTLSVSSNTKPLLPVLAAHAFHGTAVDPMCFL